MSTHDRNARRAAVGFAESWVATLCAGLLASPTAWAAGQGTAMPPLDLPLCEAAAPGKASGLSLGIVQPGASQAVLDFAARLSLANPQLDVCQESWSSVLPRWLPWAQELERGHGFVLFVLAFVAVVSVLWFTTPRRWWQRTTLLAVLAVGGLTWIVGAALLAAFHAVGGQQMLYANVVSLRMPQQARPAWHNVAGARELEDLLASAGLGTAMPHQAALGRPQPAAAAAASGTALATAVAAAAASANAGALPAGVGGPAAQPQAPSGPYRVAHRLNLRTAAGVQSPWIATLPRGDIIEFDGAQQGDWWRIRARSGQVGWASSLWLRRLQEGLPSQGDTAPATKG